MEILSRPFLRRVSELVIFRNPIRRRKNLMDDVFSLICGWVA